MNFPRLCVVACVATAIFIGFVELLLWGLSP